jgi:HlyD family secretion protein
VSQQRLDDAETTARVALERRAAAQEAVSLLQAGTRQQRIQAARADVATARSTSRMMRARESDLVLVASVDGRVLARLAEPGEVLAANTPVVSIGERGRPFVRAYAKARDLTRMSVGDTVTVALDGVDGVTAAGRIAAISPQAEFTPRVALTEAERADLMFGVKIEFDGNAAGLYPGMWAAVSGFRRTPAPAGSE